MSALQRAARAWMFGHQDDALPGTITITPFMPESGRAASRSKGIVHTVTEAALIEDAEDARMVATWLCGGSALDAMEVLDDSDPLCASCQLAQHLPSGACVYRAWDAAGDLLYIGSTINPTQRIRAHATQTHWWPLVARLTFEQHESEGGARKAESTAIWNEPSRFNRGGTRPKSVTAMTLLAGIEIETSRGGVA